MNNTERASDGRAGATDPNNHNPDYGDDALSASLADTPAVESPGHGPHHDLVAGVGIMIGAGLLLLQTTEIPASSALLPIAILGALVVLAVLMILRVLVGASSKRPATPRYKVFTDRRRFVGVISCIAIYIVGVALLGFYTTTAVMIPVVAWCFGYRNVKRILLADLIFTGGLAVIFVVLMGQELPAEFFVR